MDLPDRPLLPHRTSGPTQPVKGLRTKGGGTPLYARRKGREAAPRTWRPRGLWWADLRTPKGPESLVHFLGPGSIFLRTHAGFPLFASAVAGEIPMTAHDCGICQVK